MFTLVTVVILSLTLVNNNRQMIEKDRKKSKEQAVVINYTNGMFKKDMVKSIDDTNDTINNMKLAYSKSSNDIDKYRTNMSNRFTGEVENINKNRKKHVDMLNKQTDSISSVDVDINQTVKEQSNLMYDDINKKFNEGRYNSVKDAVKKSGFDMKNNTYTASDFTATDRNGTEISLQNLQYDIEDLKEKDKTLENLKRTNYNKINNIDDIIKNNVIENNQRFQTVSGEIDSYTTNMETQLGSGTSSIETTITDRNQDLVTKITQLEEDIKTGLQEDISGGRANIGTSFNTNIDDYTETVNVLLNEKNTEFESKIQTSTMVDYETMKTNTRMSLDTAKSDIDVQIGTLNEKIKEIRKKAESNQRKIAQLQNDMEMKYVQQSDFEAQITNNQKTKMKNSFHSKIVETRTPFYAKDIILSYNGGRNSLQNLNNDLQDIDDKISTILDLDYLEEDGITLSDKAILFSGCDSGDEVVIKKDEASTDIVIGKTNINDDEFTIKFNTKPIINNTYIDLQDISEKLSTVENIINNGITQTSFTSNLNTLANTGHNHDYVTHSDIDTMESNLVNKSDINNSSNIPDDLKYNNITLENDMLPINKLNENCDFELGAVEVPFNKIYWNTEPKIGFDLPSYHTDDPQILPGSNVAVNASNISFLCSPPIQKIGYDNISNLTDTDKLHNNDYEISNVNLTTNSSNISISIPGNVSIGSNALI